MIVKEHKRKLLGEKDQKEFGVKEGPYWHVDSFIPYLLHIGIGTVNDLYGHLIQWALSSNIYVFSKDDNDAKVTRAAARLGMVVDMENFLHWNGGLIAQALSNKAIRLN